MAKYTYPGPSSNIHSPHALYRSCINQGQQEANITVNSIVDATPVGCVSLCGMCVTMVQCHVYPEFCPLILIRYPFYSWVDWSKCGIKSFSSRKTPGNGG